MKKLMFAAAAIAAGVAVADVTSANIVGYAGTPLSETGGATISAPMFITVGGEGSIKLGSIVPASNLTKKEIRGNIEIQTLKTDGTTGDEDYFWDGEVWTDEEDNDMSDVDMTAGKGYWVYNSTGKPVTFQSAGQVNDQDIVRPLSSTGGAVPFVNGFPVAVTLADLVVESDLTKKEIRGNIEIQTLKTDGTTGDEDYFWDGETWTDEEDNDVSDTPVAAGKGFWIYNSTGKPVAIRIANPVFGD